jgi:aminomethyltransferase
MSGNLKHTAFYNKHIENQAKMVPFAGYEMPIQYPAGIRAEHKRVRETVGVFDVSHMGEVIVKGEAALEYLQKITTNDVSKLAIGQVHYSTMCYEDGGIVDDLLVYRAEDHYLCVINASNIDKDLEWMLKNKIENVEITNVSDDWAQLAVQGKKAEETLQKLTDVDLSAIKYYWFTFGELGGVEMIISRTGYTGEPGFELYIPIDKAEVIWDKVFEAGKEFDIEPAGLGSRDSLRLEKKMCLYGNDIDETTTPLEAGLGWITKLDKGDFIGRDVMLKQKEEGLKRKFVSLLFDDKKAFPRKGYQIVNENDEVLGEITSGTISPMLEVGIATAYVKTEFAKTDSTVYVQIRKKKFPVKIIKGAFV